MRVRIFDLQIDDWNADEAGRHGVSEREIRQVLDNEPVFLPNKRGHRAPIIMIGPHLADVCSRSRSVPPTLTTCGGRQPPGTRQWPSVDGTTRPAETALFQVAIVAVARELTMNERMGPDDIELGDEVVEVERRPRSGVVVAVRLTADEADLLQTIAEGRKTTLSRIAWEAISRYLATGGGVTPPPGSLTGAPTSS